MSAGWTVQSNLPVSFTIKTVKNILDPNNNSLLELGDSSRRLLFVDSEVFSHFGKKIHLYFSRNNIEAKIVPIDISEEKKDIETLMFILNTIENFGLLRRNEPIICMGGGVLLDIVGFASNLFRRSVPYIKVPTTLLAIVDASIGVKTSINHFGRRNRLGSYYAPQGVYLDKTFLETVPPQEIHQAMGEIIKIAVIKNTKLLSLLEVHAPQVIKEKFLVDGPADKIISHAIHDMIQELQPDLLEKNLERVVDFGHSFSPLIEMNSLKDSTVSSLPHGQAVTLDIIFSSCLSYNRGLLGKESLNRIIELCQMCNLSVTHPYFKNVLMLWESLLDTTKHRNGNQNLPIPNRLGSCVFINDVTLPEVHDVVGVFEKFTE